MNIYSDEDDDDDDDGDDDDDDDDGQDNGGCEHLCINQPGGHECVCRPGFRFSNYTSYSSLSLSLLILIFILIHPKSTKFNPKSSGLSWTLIH